MIKKDSDKLTNKEIEDYLQECIQSLSYIYKLCPVIRKRLVRLKKEQKKYEVKHY